MNTLQKIVGVLNWLNAINSGEFITAPGYSKSGLEMPDTDEKELDLICSSVNGVLDDIDFGYYIVYNFQTIVPFEIIG